VQFPIALETHRLRRGSAVRCSTRPNIHCTVIQLGALHHEGRSCFRREREAPPCCPARNIVARSVRVIWSVLREQGFSPSRVPHRSIASRAWYNFYATVSEVALYPIAGVPVAASVGYLAAIEYYVHDPEM